MPAKPTNMSASSSSSSTDAADRRFVWVHSVTHPAHTPSPGSGEWPVWLVTCHRLTPHLQRFSDDTALLDLGLCTDSEAMAAVQALITRLHLQHVTLRAAIAPSGILAQFALLHASAHEPLTLVTADQAATVLREIPVAALVRLQVADPSTHTSLTPKMLAQVAATLDSYGIRTVAQLARFDESRLRRQFGARVGAFLLAVARGEDIFPFQPTPAPLQLHFRLRLTAALSPDCLAAGLKPFTLEVASTLARRGLQAHTLVVRLRWESGQEERISRTLSQPIAGGRTLHETLMRLVTPFIQSDTGVEGIEGIEGVDDFRLTLSHLVPLYPAQHAFWPQRTRRLAALDQLADVLTQRHGRPILLRSLLTVPDAIFEQDRSQFAPLQAHVAHTPDVLNEPGQHAARPTADVSDESADMPHGIHWW